MRSLLFAVCCALTIASPVAAGAQDMVEEARPAALPPTPLAQRSSADVGAAPGTTGGGADSPATARWEMTARLGSRWITDPAFDLVSETDAVFTVGIASDYRPGWLDDRLGIEISFDSSPTSATSFEVLKSSLSLLSIGAAASYRLPVHEAHQLVARAGASYDWVSVRIEDERFDEAALVQTAGILGLQATLGYELAFLFDPRGAPDSTALVVGAEVGYSLYPSAASFDDLHRDRDLRSKPRPIASRGASLGELDPSGFLLRFGIGLRF
ncbi:MAG TPA: hypothetical protein VGD74_08405 [Vulgatibacter sp.]